MNTYKTRKPGVLAAACAALALFLAGCLTDDKGQERNGPTISVGPSDEIVAEGAQATFSVTASGSGELRYQWIRNGEDLPGRVTDDNGSTTSDPAWLRIRVSSEALVLGAQSSLLASSVDLDEWETYDASEADNYSDLIDLVFAYSTATGNDSLALYSPLVAKNGVGGSSGFDFMQDWPSAANTEIRRVEVADWENVLTAADIKALFDNGTAGSTPGRVFVREGTTVVVRSNKDLYVLMRVTAITTQSASGNGTIAAKAKW
jgi:hypothetical protein